MNYLIIAAGGNGARMGLHHNKIFAKIGQHPIIFWTIKAFEENDIVDQIIISTREEDVKKINQIIKKHKFKKILKIIPALKSRQESTFVVLKWLKKYAKPDDLIGVHNGVNPFVSHEEVCGVYESAKTDGASLLAHPATDTIKISDDKDCVEKTPPRQYCWYAQTPQVSSFKNMYRAFVKADEDEFMGTDDTQLLERIGIKAKIIKCSHKNFKITYPEDLVVAKNILKKIKKTNGKKDKNPNSKTLISNLDCHSRVGGNLISNGHLFIGSPHSRG